MWYGLDEDGRVVRGLVKGVANDGNAVVNGLQWLQRERRRTCPTGRPGHTRRSLVNVDRLGGGDEGVGAIHEREGARVDVWCAYGMEMGLNGGGDYISGNVMGRKWGVGVKVKGGDERELKK